MIKISRQRIIIYLAVAAVSLGLCFGLVVSAQAGSGAVPTKAGSLHQEVAEANVWSVTTPFPLNALAWRWDGGRGSEWSVRFKGAKAWSDWIPVTADEDSRTDAKQTQGVTYSNLLFVESTTKFEYRLDRRGDGLRAVDVYYLKTVLDRPWWEQAFGWLVPPAEGADLDVISRADWGADESLRFNGDNEELWPTEYAEPKAFIIHHTAGSNGQPDLAKAKAVVRGIYYYHTVVRQWGDIGYNYLIDTAGNVFEGRSGGDGVTGAHTYRGTDCPGKGAEQGYNSGSIGVALLGNYERLDHLTDEAKAALAHVLAVKGRLLNIDPASETFFKDRTISAVFSHIDVDCTVCPGQRVRTALADIRSQAAAEFATLPAPVEDGTVSARRLRQSATDLTLRPGQTAEVWVDMKNTGTAVWRRYANAPQLIPTNGAARALRSTSWPDEAVASEINDGLVLTGQTGRFRFTVTAPTGRDLVEATFKLSYQGNNLAGTFTRLRIKVSGRPYAAEVTESSFPAALLQQSSRTVTFSFRNSGSEPWRQGEVKLKVDQAGGDGSSFTTKVGDRLTGTVDLAEEAVATGQVGHYTVTFISPDKVGRYQQSLYLERNGERLPGSKFLLKSRVDSPSQAALAGIELPAAMLNTWAVPATVRFTNTGVTVWDRSIVLKIMNDDGGPSSFYDPSWPGALGEIVMQEARVLPGQTATFQFRLRAPIDQRVYTQLFKLIDRDDAENIIQHPVAASLIRVDQGVTQPKGRASLLDESIPVALRTSWRPVVTVRFKNDGHNVWDQSVRLNVYGALYRRPEFRDYGWTRQTGGIPMNEASVAPGGTASFTFRLGVPSELQIYQILFQLSQGPEQAVMPGSYFSELIRVDP